MSSIALVNTGLPSLFYTAPNISNGTTNTVYNPVWTVVSAKSRYDSTIVPTTLVDGNGAVHIPTSGNWRIVIDGYFQGATNAGNLNTGQVCGITFDDKTVSAPPTSYGYLAIQLTYERYITAGTVLAKAGIQANYGGYQCQNLVMNISKTS